MQGFPSPYQAGGMTVFVPADQNEFGKFGRIWLKTFLFSPLGEVEGAGASIAL